MTPEARKIRGADARQLLENALLKEAFAAVGEHIDAQALNCDLDDPARAQRIVISKQLLTAIKRELTRVVQDGEVAQVQIAEIEKKRGMLRRLTR